MLAFRILSIVRRRVKMMTIRKRLMGRVRREGVGMGG